MSSAAAAGASLSTVESNCCNKDVKLNDSDCVTAAEETSSNTLTVENSLLEAFCGEEIEELNKEATIKAVQKPKTISIHFGVGVVDGITAAPFVFIELFIRTDILNKRSRCRCVKV